MGICSLPTQEGKELNAGESGNNIQERMRRRRRGKGEVLIKRRRSRKNLLFPQRETWKKAGLDALLLERGLRQLGLKYQFSGPAYWKVEHWADDDDVIIARAIFVRDFNF